MQIEYIYIFFFSIRNLFDNSKWNNAMARNKLPERLIDGHCNSFLEVNSQNGIWTLIPIIPLKKTLFDEVTAPLDDLFFSQKYPFLSKVRLHFLWLEWHRKDPTWKTRPHSWRQYRPNEVFCFILVKKKNSLPLKSFHLYFDLKNYWLLFSYLLLLFDDVNVW